MKVKLTAVKLRKYASSMEKILNKLVLLMDEVRTRSYQDIGEDENGT